MTNNKELKVISQVDTPEAFRLLCFNLTPTEKLQFPKDLFELNWGHFEHVFVRDGSKNVAKYGYSQYFYCRFANKRQGYTPVSEEVRKRKATHYIENLCDVKVKY